MVYKKTQYAIILFLLCLVILSGCGNNSDTSTKSTTNDTNKDVAEEVATDKQKANPPITDNDFLYKEDNDTSIVNMYLTVRQGNASESTNHTWNEINSHSVYYYTERNIERYQAEAILHVEDAEGNTLGTLASGVQIPNAIVSIRGQTSSRMAIKSYKISIKDGKGTWNDQKVINLNKHVSDGLRFRNKLAYDLMEELPGMISLRTQFVHLYVKDETEGANGGFVDYGLFTQVEQPNKTFLANHGLDKYGQLYKINFFEFYRYEDTIKLATDATYDEQKFEKYLEIKGDNDHSKLIEMLDDVNDYTKPIEEVFSKWFEEDNFFSWMAFQILIGNNDTQSRNTMLYSPLNVKCFYFISWDNDSSLDKSENMLKYGSVDLGWETGISNYWGNVLFQRILKSETYQKKLKEKIEAYRKILTEEKLKSMVSSYNSVVWDFRNSVPDQLSNPITNEEYQEVCSKLPTEIETNYQLYLESIEKPMPFYIGTPKIDGNIMSYNWEVSYDFHAEDIKYTFELATDYSFSNPIIKQENLMFPETSGTALAPGQYFIRVTATNASGYTQTAFDYYVTQRSVKIFGTKCFYVLADGSIVEDKLEEK